MKVEQSIMMRTHDESIELREGKLDIEDLFVDGEYLRLNV